MEYTHRRDYRVFLVKGDEPPTDDEPKPADVRKAVQEIMEYLKKEHPKEIDLDQVPLSAVSSRLRPTERGKKKTQTTRCNTVKQRSL